MNLGDHADKEAGNLSGGNKRKLQVAIAIIGSPSIVLLDEPSAGMDPEARRFMWSVVAGISQKRKKCAVILTTHSMEEAEALSSKMGIMVKGGVFKCFGSVQHIKNKYGTGYELEIKIKGLSKKQLLEMAKRFALSVESTKLTIDEIKKLLTDNNVDNVFISQIARSGLGDSLVREAETNKQGHVRTAHMLEWLHAVERGVKVIAALAY
jgi:ATP-binding cassette subfamily A (ABC1) protein 3